MSGHSKWATIRRKKALIDAKRGQAFTKLIREVTVAARIGGGDIERNPRLRLAVNAARASNMPADNITRAIKKGTGELEGVHYEEVTYEGYAAGGVAIMVDCVTDNRNRTIAEIRHVFTKHAGTIGEAGSVGWMFDLRGLVTVPAQGVDEDRLMEVALEAGADDVRRAGGDGDWEVVTRPEDFHAVRDALEAAKVTLGAAELGRIPKDVVRLEGKEAAQVLRLVEALDEHDDVQKVWANYEIPDEELERIAAEG